MDTASISFPTMIAFRSFYFIYLPLQNVTEVSFLAPDLLCG